MPGFPVLHYLPEFDPINAQNFNVYSELWLFSFILGSRISFTFCLCDQILTYEERLSVSTSQVLYKTVLTMGFPQGSVVKNPSANAGDVSSVPGSGRSPGEGTGKPVQYSCLSVKRRLVGYRPWSSKRARHGLADKQQTATALTIKEPCIYSSQR